MENIQGNQREAILIGYLAGIIDGEGSFSLAKTQPKTRHYEGYGKQNYVNPIYTAKCTIGMCDGRILELFQNRYGGSIRVECVPNRQPVYRYSLGKRYELKVLIDELAPYLIEKKERAYLLKEFIENTTFGRVKVNGKVQKTSIEEISKREDFYLKMKELNAKKAPATTNREDT